MSILSANVDAAIDASGKTAEEIADALGVNANTISRIRRGWEDNPKVQLIIGIARETGTTAAALLGGSINISREDEQELLQFRGWIDGKLATIDALREPNAEIISQPSAVRERRIADRRRDRAEHPFGADARLALRALGESMIHDGILPNDMLYATAPDTPDGRTAVGKIIACRVGDGMFVKRLASEHGRRLLLSANPRYLPIAVDADQLPFEILGIVIGRVGRVS